MGSTEGHFLCSQRARNLLTACLAVAVLLSAGCSYMYKRLGGDFYGPPEKMAEALSPEALALIKEAYQGISADQFADYHTHLVGLGTGNSGIMVHPGFLSWTSPRRRVQFNVYMSAAGIRHPQWADLEYLERLDKLIENKGGPAGKHYVLAFDKHYRKDGTVDLDATEFYVPNEWAWFASEKYPQHLLPTMSVHPYRPDALQELERWAKKGVKILKWLPNAMGMDPADPDLDPFYRKMNELGVTLLTHAGHEAAVEAEADQKLGNPLRLRRPLDLGVKVIVAHCASWGENEDLDQAGRPMVSNFTLFKRLMSEAKYVGLLYGEISTITQFNRLDEALRSLLDHPEWHSRLVNGSDYPLPAINFLIQLKKLVALKYLTPNEADLLREIYHYNPLTFDFVLKRTVRHPTKFTQFSGTVFEALKL